MYNNVIDTGKSVSFVLKDIDVGGQIQYLTCTGPLCKIHIIASLAKYIFLYQKLSPLTIKIDVKFTKNSLIFLTLLR